MRKKQLIAEGIGGRPNKFLTLTLRRRDDITPDQAAYWLAQSWRKLRMRLMRWYRLKSLPFLAVVEKHKSGWPHMHIIMRAPFMDHEIISEWMYELCDGPIVSIQHLDQHHKAPVYCAKYCGKATEKFETTKRYWQSRDWDLRPKYEHKHGTSGADPWHRRQTPLRTIYHMWLGRGHAVEYVAANKVAVTWSKERSPP